MDGGLSEMEENKKSGGWDVRASKSPYGVLCTTPCKRGEAERSLETATPKAMSLGGSVEARIIGRDMPPLIHTMRHFLP